MVSSSRTKRVVAYIIDSLIIGVVVAVFSLALGLGVLGSAFAEMILFETDGITIGILSFPVMISVEDIFHFLMLMLVYVVLTLRYDWQTIGRKIMGVKIVKLNGEGAVEPLDQRTLIIREVLYIYLLTLFTFGMFNLISILVSLFREDKRCLHDVLSGTIYVDTTIPSNMGTNEVASESPTQESKTE